MKVKYMYPSTIGDITLIADEYALIGIFIGEDDIKQYENLEYAYDHDQINQMITWLDAYFDKRLLPNLSPILLLKGTPFQKDVWEILTTIPFGKLTTYGEIANVLAKKYGKLHMSAQAVGQAVGQNPFSIFIPCHRIIGKNHELTGYRGGLKVKKQLLIHEGHEVSETDIVKSL